MIKAKLKLCAGCGLEKHIWKQIEGKKYCQPCAFDQKEKGAPKQFSSIKKKMPKPSGELQLFLSIYAERKGVCQVTGKAIPFSPSAFAHILSKGAYPKFRLNAENILLCHPDFHFLLDNSSKEKALEKFPNAEFVWDLKEKLKSAYYQQ